MQQRLLNIELLRIFSMFLITLGHVRVHFMNDFTPALSNTFMNYIVVFILFHVNLFILITGYFGVQHCKRSLVNTVLQLYFYSITINIVTWTFSNSYNIEDALMPISHGSWWFMTKYVVMLMIAPFIENFVKDCTDKRIHIIAIGALFVNMYLGHFNHIGHLYDEGYGMTNFICIYILGVWIRKNGTRLIKRLMYPRLFLILIIILIMAIQYKCQPYFSWNDMTEYCGPYSTFMAVLIFFLFVQTTVPECCRKVIISLSSSAIAVYLITDHVAIRGLLKPMFRDLYLPYQNSVTGLVIIMLSVVVAFLACCAIDKIRIPVTEYLANKILNIPFVNRL